MSRPRKIKRPEDNSKSSGRKLYKIPLVFIIFVILAFAVSSARLPVVGSDLDSWGDILSNYLRVSHTENGSINATTEAQFLGNMQFIAPSAEHANISFGVAGTEKVHRISYDDNTGDLNFVTDVGATDPNALSVLFADGTVRIGEGLNFGTNLNIDANTLFVDAINNRVGIGTASPTDKLTINGAVQLLAAAGGITNITFGIIGTPFVQKIRYDDNTGDLDFLIEGSPASLSILFADGSVRIGQGLNVNANLTIDLNTLFVDALNNRVGIGISNPDALIHIQSVVSANRAIQADSLLIVENNADAGIQIITPSSNIGSIFFGDTDADIGNIQYNHITNEMRFTTNNAPRLTIQSDGDVGIGTTSPNVELEVVGTPGASVGGFASGTLHLTDPSASENANAVITGHNSFGGNKQLWYLGSTSSSNDNIAFINRQNSNLQLNTNNLARLTIVGDGSIGIGKTAPNFKLDVAGTINASGYSTEAGAGITGSCGSATTLTVQDGIIVACS